MRFFETTAKLRLVLIAFLGALFLLVPNTDAHAQPAVKMYKNASCSCCEGWVAHLHEAGFEVTIINVDDVYPLKEEFGVPEEVWSCHTAMVDGYIVEGHVPAEDILKLLEEKPDVLGIAVPGMPIGSPGMEMPGMEPESYNSVLFTKDGKITVYVRH